MSGGTRDVLVIGGGFYGCCIALYLKRERGCERVLVVEREADLLTRASYVNQARVHNGYHYPRSFTTAYRSRINLPRFAEEFADSIVDDFTKVYAIARRNSHVNARQFERFCRDIGAPCEPAPPAVASLFSRQLIEQSFLVREFAFDAVRLRDGLRAQLERAGVEVWLEAEVRDVRADGGLHAVTVARESGERTVRAATIFNCTYAGLNGVGPGFGRLKTGIKHEITEMALVSMPDELAGLGVTVMDGPFFSAMPFPARGLHTLSHVRYTPHGAWTSDDRADDGGAIDSYGVLDRYAKVSRAGYMIRDAARYLPALGFARLEDSLFEVKTVLLANEVDDGRPIMVERHPTLPEAYSVLGGKVDNIFDIYPLLADCTRVTHHA